MDYMNKSEEDANKVLNNLEYIKKNVKSGSQRYRKTNASMCLQAVESTKEMIKTISSINKLNVNEWIDQTHENLTYSLIENDVNAIEI